MSNLTRRVLRNHRNRTSTDKISHELAHLLWSVLDELDNIQEWVRDSVPQTPDEIVHGHRHHEPFVYLRYGHTPLAHPTTCQMCMYEFWVVYTPAHPALKMPACLWSDAPLGVQSPSVLYCPVCGADADSLEIGTAVIPVIDEPVRVL